MGRKRRHYRFNLPPGKNSRKYKKHNPPMLDQTTCIGSSEELPFKTSTPKEPKYLKTQNTSGLKFLFQKTEPPYLNIEGSRIINLELLDHHMTEVASHVGTCAEAIRLASIGDRPIKLLGEGKSCGLACFLHTRCLGCGKQFTFSSSPRVKTAKSRERFEINVRGVWGQMSTGGGGAHLGEIMTTMGMPALSANQFCAIEDDIRVWWEEALLEELTENGREERELAIANGEFHEGVPSITVIADGGWSKRSHKHSYNALGGVGVIFGARTKKLLHVGVRSKFCIVCTRAENKNVKPPIHECFRNWEESSQSMEADIMLEGFQKCERTHGVRYTKLIGDGDSSTFSSLVKNGPHWCRDLVKIDCSNHVCKCLRGHLEKLVLNTSNLGGRNGLTKRRRAHLTAYVRYCIRKRSLMSDKHNASMKLAQDIKTSIWHVFGRHSNCSSDICKGNNSTNPTTTPCKDTVESLEDVLDEQVQVWQDLEDEDNTPGVTSTTRSITISDTLLQAVLKILDPIARKASSLVNNATTNLCEGWMSLRAKFDGGKQIFRGAKSSWFARCYGAALRSSLGAQWSPDLWEKCSGKRKEALFVNFFHRRQSASTKQRIFKAKVETRRKAFKRKQYRLKEASSKKARQHYGKDAIQVMSDISVKELEDNCTDFYKQQVEKSHKHILEIEEKTKDQAANPIWIQERRLRLTSSHFHDILKRRESTSSTQLVERLLYSSFEGNHFTDYGSLEEGNALQDYSEFMDNKGTPVMVTTCGLVIHPKFNFLGCSPDGLVTETNSGNAGLVEVKNLLCGKPLTLLQAAGTIKSFCLSPEQGTLHVKHSHRYYTQCQGQMFICNKSWVDFVVRSTNPNCLHVERIHKDVDMWEKMYSKLKTFFFEVLLPELANPRHGKHPGIREAQSGLNLNLQSQFESLSGEETASTCNNKYISRPTLLVGSVIEHKWVLDEGSQTCQWFKGSSPPTPFASLS